MSQDRDGVREPMTVEQWAALDDDVAGELVDGLLVDEEEATFLHAVVVTELAVQFLRWTEERVLVAGPTRKLALSPLLGRKPDVSVWLPGSRIPNPRARVSYVPPDVAVEVLTATPRDVRRDRIGKFDEYAAFGVRFYWLVDPEVRTVEVFELRDAPYVRVLGACEGATIPVPGVPDAVLDLDAIWHRLDELVRQYASQDR